MNILKIKFHSKRKNLWTKIRFSISNYILIILCRKKNVQNINTTNIVIKGLNSIQIPSIYAFNEPTFDEYSTLNGNYSHTSHIWPTTANVSVPIHISKSIVLDHEGGRSRRTGNVAFAHGTRSIFVLKEQLDVDFVASTCRRCDSFRFSFLMHFQVHRAKGNSQTLISRSFHEAQRMDSMKWVHIYRKNIYVYASRFNQKPSNETASKLISCREIGELSRIDVHLSASIASYWIACLNKRVLHNVSQCRFHELRISYPQLLIIIKRRIIMNRFDPWNEHSFFFFFESRNKVTENARIA